MKTKRTLADFKRLTEAENRILAEIDTGKPIDFGGLPSANDETRRVRAEFIRYLALNGCDSCRPHEKGLQVAGIWVDGLLDLEGCNVGCDVAMIRCRFSETLKFDRASLQGLYLNESYLTKDLTADELIASGTVNLNRITAKGPVRLLGAAIAGNLECLASSFQPAQDSKGNFDGYAFSLQNATVGHNFIWTNMEETVGALNFSGASVGVLVDDKPSPHGNNGPIMLNHFQYGAIISGPTDAKSRLKWLALRGDGGNFEPQPYEQLAKVMREMGHRSDAREVLIEKERLQRKDRRRRRSNWMWPFYFATDFILNITVRYGHRPLLAFAWLAVFWSLGVVIFAQASTHNAFKPNTSRILHAEEWVSCLDDPRSQLACYLDKPKAHSYPKLNVAIYSADTLLPIVDLEMQGNWIPDENIGPWGLWARRFLWLQIISGWGLSLLAVAGFSGLIKSD